MENVSFFHECILSIHLPNHALKYGAVKVVCLNIMQGHLPWIEDDKNSNTQENPPSNGSKRKGGRGEDWT